MADIYSPLQCSSWSWLQSAGLDAKIVAIMLCEHQSAGGASVQPSPRSRSHAVYPSENLVIQWPPLPRILEARDEVSGCAGNTTDGEVWKPAGTRGKYFALRLGEATVCDRSGDVAERACEASLQQILIVSEDRTIFRLASPRSQY